MESTLKLATGLIAALVIAQPSAAQTTHMGMPEGSKEIFLSLAIASSPSHEGSARRQTFVAPLIAAQFSNGVFIDMNTVGMHLSRTPAWRYGVQFAPTFSRTQIRTDDGWESKRKLTPEAGGFVSYSLAHGIHLRSSLMYGASTDHRGLRLRFGASAETPLAEHHAAGVDIDATLANRSALQADFAVLPAHAGPGLPAYEVSGGLRETRVGVYWSWQLSNKYTLRTFLRRDRLHGSAAASPRTEQASGVTAITMLAYQF